MLIAGHDERSPDMPSDQYMKDHLEWERQHAARENEVMAEIRRKQDEARAERERRS